MQLLRRGYVIIMKKIYLIRHAKSDWAYEDLPDIDRPLNERGYRDAHEMSKRLKEKKHAPDLIISSPAIRALSTALIFARTFEYPENEIKIIRRLYHASPDVFVNTIAGIEEGYDRVFLFSHNPGITEAVNILCERDRVDNMPTTGIAGIELKDWRATDSAKLTFFDYPKNHG